MDPRAEIYLNLEFTGFTDPLYLQNGFRRSLNTLKLCTKFANVFTEKGFTVFFRFFEWLSHFQVICFTQLDPKFTSQLYMQMLT